MIGPQSTKLSIILWIIALTIFTSFGQIFFKMASAKIITNQGAPQLLSSIIQSHYFWLASTIYALTTLMWVTILSKVPLAVGIPLTSLPLIIVPILGWVFFSERLDLWFFLGTILILSGIWLTTLRWT